MVESEEGRSVGVGGEGARSHILGLDSLSPAQSKLRLKI